MFTLVVLALQGSVNAFDPTLLPYVIECRVISIGFLTS